MTKFITMHNKCKPDIITGMQVDIKQQANKMKRVGGLTHI